MTVRAALLAVLLGLIGAPAAHAARPLSLGFLDGVYTSRDAAERDLWLAKTVAVNASIVRIEIGSPAPDTPVRPPNFDARDPADPHYDFARADAAIVAARAHGLRVLVSFTRTPRWADGPGRPEQIPAGTWRPSPAVLEDFGAALARRYSGSFPDPARPGSFLPRVEGFQVWNEPNLDKYLSPQWNGRRAASPGIYRGMLSAFYRGVKSVDRRALVVSAGTGPFGDPQAGGHRVAPARFWRELLCLRTVRRRLRTSACPNPARFDVLAHHPYSVGQPRRRALNADDVSIPDIGKLTRLLRFAERRGRALPRKRHRVWVTEASYDSRPPDPLGVPASRHARWLQETLYLLWKQGVDTITWFQVRDAAPIPSFAATNQSGVYLRDGRAKLAARGFAFPFVVERRRAWGRSPRAGTLLVQRRTGASWRTVRRVEVRRDATFLVRLGSASRGRLRAKIADQTSLPWLTG